MPRWTICSAACLFVSMSTIAQQADFALGARAGYGYLIAHHDNLKRMVDGHIPSIELCYERVVSGRQAWHRSYKSPSWGMSFYAADLRAEELGNAFALTPYLLLPLTFDDRQSLDLRFGWGLGVVTHPFDKETNYKGHAIGSTVNVHMLLGVEYRRQFGRTSIGVGLGINHLSNGAFRVPNLGINLPAVQLSVRQELGTRQPVDTAGYRARDNAIGPQRVFAYATIGMKETFPVNSGKHMAYALVVAATKPLGGKIQLEGGLDVFHNTSLEQRAQEDGQEPPTTLTQAGLHLGGGLILRRLIIVWQAGVYVFNVFEEDGMVFNRVGFRHTLGQRWLVNFTLKTHLATADHFELGFGYRFR